MLKAILPAVVLTLFQAAAFGGQAGYALPVAVGSFEQQVHRAYTTEQGLPSNDVSWILLDADGAVIAWTALGEAVFDGTGWQPTQVLRRHMPDRRYLVKDQLAALYAAGGPATVMHESARHKNEWAVAASTGLFIGDGTTWKRALPQQGAKRWAPIDVRAVAYDADGMLWFACRQGVGYRVWDEDWHLFTGADGLPYNKFTCMAAAPDGMWFGTHNGAVFYRNGKFSFRQGRRWLLDNDVRHMAVDSKGNAWFATAAGVSCIAHETTTLAGKAAFFEDEIEKHHRRTSFGYVDPAELSAPGDKSSAVPKFTDNDGHNTGLYLGAVSLGYAATRNAKLRQDAVNAFRALAFLSEVTQGGTHPAPKGFIARAVVPTSESDPNPDFNLDYDLRRQKADALWKVIQPRWPVDATGKWYWKNDSSSDELDGHFFGYAIYFDRVCQTEAEKDEAREVVRRIMDHILEHGYNLVDYDGTPTRWGRFSPEDLNKNPVWCAERGLNSFSILTYLSVAYHITGDQKYRDAYLTLAIDHGYAMNGMTQPVESAGPGSYGHQPDDNMAFMNYYHLIRYESDPKLLSMYYYAIYNHWQVEKLERNPFENFVYAACCLGKTRTDQWGDLDVSPPKSCFEDAVDTLKRYPLDLVDWPMSNAHRTDRAHPRNSSKADGRNDGYAFPIDERAEIYQDRDPWALTYDGKGMRLRDPVHYLLAYYMGRAHGFIAD